jgi:hypothetical protein
VSLAKSRALSSGHLLTGLLCTSDGQQWVAHGRYYRFKRQGQKRGKLVQASIVDKAVLDQITADMQSDQFLTHYLSVVKRAKAAIDPAAEIDERITQLQKEKQRLRAWRSHLMMRRS